MTKQDKTTPSTSSQRLDKINPFPKGKCPKCGGNIMNVFGIIICKDCEYKKDLYDKTR